MLVLMMACSAPEAPIVIHWKADRAATIAELRAMPDLERGLALQLLARTFPGETSDICPLAPDSATLRHCARINERPHLKGLPGNTPIPSEKRRLAPGPGSDRLPVPPVLDLPWRAGAPPACANDACVSEKARAAAIAKDWPAVLGACMSIGEDRWRHDCYFQAAEAAVEVNGPSAYHSAAVLCTQAEMYRAQCIGHLSSDMARLPDQAVAALEQEWADWPVLLEIVIDQYWAEHSMSVFSPNPSRPSTDPRADKYYRMERALSLVKGEKHVRPLWPQDDLGEDALPAARFRASGRRTYSDDPEIDARICALEAEAAREQPRRDRFIDALTDPDRQVRWTAVRLLRHFDPAAPALLKVETDPDPVVARRARSPGPRGKKPL